MRYLEYAMACLFMVAQIFAVCGLMEFLITETRRASEFPYNINLAYLTVIFIYIILICIFNRSFIFFLKKE